MWLTVRNKLNTCLEFIKKFTFRTKRKLGAQCIASVLRQKIADSTNNILESQNNSKTVFNCQKNDTSKKIQNCFR